MIIYIALWPGVKLAAVTPDRKTGDVMLKVGVIRYGEYLLVYFDHCTSSGLSGVCVCVS